MEWTYLIFAAFCFAIGGLFMKSSAGATRLNPTVAFISVFIIGAVLQARAMKRSDMGVVYLAVLGLEAILALSISAMVLQEKLSWQRLIAACLIVLGVVLLRRS
jgi:multidrug transporter EmrE-like cation transporter